jgi:hypothetical protein
MAGIIILLFVGIGIARYLAKNAEQWDQAYGHFVKPAVFSLFILLVAVMVPVFLKCYVVGQIRIGNADHSQVVWIRTHVWQTIYGVWLLFAAGLGMALPYMIKDNFFSL